MVQTKEQKDRGLSAILAEVENQKDICIRKPLMPKRQPRRRSNPRRQLR
jgi:hypothetical protein